MLKVELNDNLMKKHPIQNQNSISKTVQNNYFSFIIIIIIFVWNRSLELIRSHLEGEKRSTKDISCIEKGAGVQQEKQQCKNNKFNSYCTSSNRTSKRFKISGLSY